ncbi:MAG: hypothetical protein L0H84_01515 [Pseudonocardia sp.]|nr:hypothetical protein [Pseudonocardia sp.]
MTAELALIPSRGAVRRLDAAALVAVLVFAALGVLAAVEVTRLAQLSASLLDAASALDQVGEALGSIAGLPLVGPTAGEVAGSVAQTASSTRANALDAAAAVRVLAIVIGVAIGLVPAPLLLTGYLPLRRARAREVRGLRRLVAPGRPVDPLLVAHLAHGAVARLPYARLRELSADPWGDLSAGRHHRLAAAELRRLGVTPPPDWSAPSRAQVP